MRKNSHNLNKKQNEENKFFSKNSVELESRQYAFICCQMAVLIQSSFASLLGEVD
jgi:hypothetical protein